MGKKTSKDIKVIGMENKQQEMCYISFASTVHCSIFKLFKYIVACPNLKVEENTWIMNFIL
jgi:hypothetical protein